MAVRFYRKLNNMSTADFLVESKKKKGNPKTKGKSIYIQLYVCYHRGRLVYRGPICLQSPGTLQIVTKVRNVPFNVLAWVSSQMEGILFFGEQLGTRRKSELFCHEVGRADYHLKCRENVTIPLHCQIERENVLTQQVEWWRGFPKVRVQNPLESTVSRLLAV